MIPEIKFNDGVGVFTPAWIVKSKKRFIKGVKKIETLGFKVVYKNFYSKIPPLESKISEFNGLIKNPETKMLIAARGGYGCIKLLSGIDFDSIKKNPKVIAGFSDLTALLNVIYEKTGVVTFHSPMILNFADDSHLAEKSFVNAVTGFQNTNLFSGARIYSIKDGIAEGILKGGNLITINSLIGTPWEISFQDAIVFLEDVDEKLHSVDRLLTQLIFCGKFSKIKGLILGDFRGVKNADVRKVIFQSMEVKFPVVYTPNIGHVKSKITLPVGARVRLNTYKKELLILK